MLLRKLKTSLTLRIFFITCFILLSASGVTFGIVALATPITYVSITTDHMREQAAALPLALEQTPLAECGPVLEAFARDTGAGVLIVDENGVIADIPYNAVSVIEHIPDNFVSAEAFKSEDAIMSYAVTTVADTAAIEGTASYFGFEYAEQKGENSAAASEVTVTDADLELPFSFKDDDAVYMLSILPPVREANQTLQAIGKVAPWLLCIMLIFSALCAMIYSRWLTRPIVGLSAISQKLATLDFSPRCEENRTDEIGLLGRSLNALSDNLSTALGDLQTANAALQQDIDRERELERQRLAFFSAASHELKTPVTILAGQLMGMIEGVGDYQDRDRYLAKALGVTRRMEGLVQEILTVSRMESGDFALDCCEVELSALVRAQLAIDADLIAQKQLDTVLELTDGIIVPVDVKLMKKVLDNILSNAVFYAPELATLTVAVKQKNGGAVLTVENSGSHIPEQSLSKVFEAFYRVESSRNRRTGGSGLGLYIVRMILERHGLAYKIENTPDGVLFTIVFERIKEKRD